MTVDIATHSSLENKAPYGPPFTVFLVDDDPDDLALASRVLKTSPQVEDVVCITNANDLFRQLQARHFFYAPFNDLRSLILLDIHMPDMDGMTLLNQLKSSPYTENIPVIMLTGDHRTDNIEKTYHMAADSFIVKPLSHGHLQHLRAVLNRDNKRQELF